VPDGLIAPDKEAEMAYKKARYAWHHKLDEAPEDIEGKLELKEVFPEYWTAVEKGKHKEYEKMSPYVITHHLYSVESIPSIIKAGGLLSNHERYRRGFSGDGSSVDEDFESGGADSVFTRIYTESGLKDYEKRCSGLSLANVSFVFNPALLDRTDWYCKR